MSWDECGDYRIGTVEMMNSKNTIVAYLKGDTEMTRAYNTYTKNYNFKWNNKKWRELFVIDEATLLGIKGYPYAHSELEAQVFNWIKELI